MSRHFRTRQDERGNVRMGGKAVDPKLARRQASVIVRRFEKRFPTAAFSAQLARRKPKAVAKHEKVVASLTLIPISNWDNISCNHI
ncbi:hypothetical protein OKW33_003370 [Paraburkholderia atlantica]|uniref:hypothetical protein n=1 Tax=Paraburkholderia atlantica TaxID=2654982 RepID=UPI003D25E7F6